MFSKPDPLCSYCSKVILDPNHLLSCAHLGLISWCLGSIERVKRSACPLCKIVLLSLQRHHQTTCTQKQVSPERLAVPDTDEVQLHWLAEEGPSQHGAFAVTQFRPRNFICFTADSKRPRSLTTFHQNEWASIAYLQADVRPEFDIERLRAWIRRCDAYHRVEESWSCWSTRQSLDLRRSGLSTLRLIDIRRCCIIECSGNTQDAVVPRYVALSYVWGGAPTVRLMRGNKSSLLQVDSLLNAWDSLPRTIRDAIVLVRKLDAEYLWIDSLCLVQDDEDDIKRGVDAMDKIYTKAWLTIIAAHGNNADAGLPGISSRSRVVDEDIVKVTEEASVGLYEDLDAIMDRTVYSTRAWTYQEQLLSNRGVYFLSNQVFFRCNGNAANAVCERMADPDSFYDLLAEGSDTVSLSESVAAKFRRVGYAGGRNPFAKIDAPVFCELLQAYTRKYFTYPGDVLRAITGIMHYYEQRVSYTFVEGMPAEAFDAFVLFRSEGRTLHRRQGYPSYSWAGWTGRIRFSDSVMENNVALNNWLSNSCPVSWHVADRNGFVSPTTIWKPDLWEQARGPRQELLRNWVQKFCKHFKDGATLADDASSETPYQDDVLSTETTGNGIPNTSQLPPRQQRAILRVRYEILQFWAISIYLHIETRNVVTGTAWILADDGEKVGVAWLDGIEDTALLGSPGPVEFILISEATGLRRGLIDEVIQALGDKIYNVLLLERGRPIAERRGVGLLAEPGTGKSAPPGPRLSEILLG